MQRLKLILYLAERCNDCEFIQSKMGNTITKLIQLFPDINFSEIIYNKVVDPELLEKTFHSDVDGILILSCHLSDCQKRHRVIRQESDLEELLDQADTKENFNLSTTGGAKWIS